MSQQQDLTDSGYSPAPPSNPDALEPTQVLYRVEPFPDEDEFDAKVRREVGGWLNAQLEGPVYVEEVTENFAETDSQVVNDQCQSQHHTQPHRRVQWWPTEAVSESRHLSSAVNFAHAASEEQLITLDTPSVTEFDFNAPISRSNTRSESVASFNPGTFAACSEVFTNPHPVFLAPAKTSSAPGSTVAVQPEATQVEAPTSQRKRNRACYPCARSKRVCDKRDNPDGICSNCRAKEGRTNGLHRKGARYVAKECCTYEPNQVSRAYFTKPSKYEVDRDEILRESLVAGFEKKVKRGRGLITKVSHILRRNEDDVAMWTRHIQELEDMLKVLERAEIYEREYTKLNKKLKCLSDFVNRNGKRDELKKKQDEAAQKLLQEKYGSAQLQHALLPQSDASSLIQQDTSDANNRRSVPSAAMGNSLFSRPAFITLAPPVESHGASQVTDEQAKTVTVECDWLAIGGTDVYKDITAKEPFPGDIDFNIFEGDIFTAGSVFDWNVDATKPRTPTTAAAKVNEMLLGIDIDTINEELRRNQHASNKGS